MESTAATVTVSTPSTPNDAVIRSALGHLPLYANATPEQRAALERDCASCLADGVTLEDYCTSLAEWDDAVKYLAEAGADSTPAGQDAPVPTSTLVEANRTLARFGAECRSQADANYRLAELAHQYVQEFLGAAPGKAQRSTAVQCLADTWRLWDEESMSQTLAKAMTRLCERVNMLLRCHAVATLLGDGRGVAKGDGTRRGRGKGGKDTRLAWGTLRELAPLVYREDSNHAETWHVLPSVADEARQLVAEIAASGMSRADVVAAVAKLMLADARLELTAATESGEAERVRQAEGAVEKWGGKVERTQEPAKGRGGRKDASTKVAAGPEDESQGDAAQDAADDEGDEGDEGDAPPARPSAESRQGQNLLMSARQGTAKDVAEMAVELVTGNDEPDDVLEHLLRQLDGHKQLCGSSHRAIKAALLVLERAARPPQGNPSANGATHAA